MTFLKKTILASVVAGLFASLYIGCGEEPIVSPPLIDTTEKTVTLAPLGGWSDIATEESGTAVTYTDTTDTSFAVTLTRAKGDGVNVWPTAVATGVVDTVNLEGVTAFVVNYTVNAATAATGTIDGVAFTISAVSEAGEFEMDRQEATTGEWYGSFNAILSTGTDSIGVQQSDTITVASDAFFLAYAGASMADSAVCANLGYTVSGTGSTAMVYLKDNLQVLEFTAGIAFGIEHDVSASEDELKITVHSVQAIGTGMTVISK